MTPLDYYQQQIENNSISFDPAQQEVIQHLQYLYFGLTAEVKRRKKWISSLRSVKTLQGIYLCGEVGIGKTFMMDCFYQCLPFSNKMRMHFHQFMQFIHRELTLLQGSQDPLEIISKKIAKQALVICFDEFHVTDITDAMLLARLLKGLFERGVCLVATSNVLPDELYKHGLQRSQFLPAIALLKKHTQVLQMKSSVDYRLRQLQKAGVYFCPLDEKSQQHMNKNFELLTHDTDISHAPIEVNGRHIPIEKESDGVVWFDFKNLCHIPRSQKDYLVIAERYQTVFLSQVPFIHAHEKDTIVLFIKLIDVLYDARVRLVMSAAGTVNQLYMQGHMAMEFARTRSRLTEMQSIDYMMEGRPMDRPNN